MWTARDESRPTDATYGEAIALLLGRPWLPYQRFVAQVAGELTPTGGYAYHTVVLTMPRQCAKTTTSYDVALGRGRAYTDYRARYATHKGTITSDRFTDWFTEIERHPRMLPDLKLRRSRGTEGVWWRRTGSYFQAFPATDGALRSAAIDLVVVDEAQEHDDVRGEALKRTIGPTGDTRPRRQLWVVFTAGTDASAYAAGYLARAQEGAPGYALFDYGCPLDVDPLDPRLWSSWHPGLAHGLTNVSALERAVEDGEAAFVREYGNRWTRTTAGPVIPADAWIAAQTKADMPAGRLCLGVDIAADRASGAIVVAGPGRHLEVVEVRAGTEWIAERALELSVAHGAPIVLDSVGPIGTVTDELVRHLPAWRRDRDLVVMKTHDVANAAAGFLDAVTGGTLAVWPHPALDEAVAAATTRPLGDSGFAWSRRSSVASIAPLIAASAALWGWDHLPPPPLKPVAYAGVGKVHGG